MLSVKDDISKAISLSAYLVMETCTRANSLMNPINLF